MTLGTFAVIIAMKRNGQPVEKHSDFAGLSRTNPLLAFFFAMLLFSLAGFLRSRASSRNSTCSSPRSRQACSRWR